MLYCQDQPCQNGALNRGLALSQATLGRVKGTLSTYSQNQWDFGRRKFWKDWPILPKFPKISSHYETE